MSKKIVSLVEIKANQMVTTSMIEAGGVVQLNSYFGGLPVVTSFIDKDSNKMIPLTNDDGSVSEMSERVFLANVWNYLAAPSQVGKNILSMSFDDDSHEFSMIVKKRNEDQTYSDVDSYNYQMTINVHRGNSKQFNTVLTGSLLSDAQIGEAELNNITLTNVSPGVFKIDCDFDFTVQIYKDGKSVFINTDFVEGKRMIEK